MIVTDRTTLPARAASDRSAPWALALAALLLAAVAGAVEAPDPSPGDVTFFQSSDVHIGVAHPKGTPPFTAEDTLARNRAVLADMQALAGRSFPPINGLPAGLEKVPRPRGLLLAGDLTDHCLPEEWQGFTQVYPLTGEGLACPVFETFGNHDGKLSGPVRAGIRSRNAERVKLGLIQAVSPNGLHYSWTWNGIHFVNLGIYPGNGPDPTSKFSAEANDPEMSLDFLVHDLESAVGRSGRPVIVSHHFGFDEGMSLGWRWWTERERRLYYEALQPYNVIAILHGHSHAPARYRWPDPKFDPKEVSAVFGAAPPSDLKTYDVFSGGSMQKDNGPGEYFVFSITGTTFIAAHRLNRNRDADGWSRQEGFDLVKTISRGQAQ